MKDLKKLIIAFAGLMMGLFPVYSQDEKDILDILNVEKENENPVYMPVIGAGIGYFNFYGNVNDAYRSFTVGKPGFRINLATFLGKNHYFRGNLMFMAGEVSATQRSTTDPLKNLNFKSNLYSFGVNVHYSFKPWIRGKFFEPFISAGIEMVQFDSKTDYTYGNNDPYNYWSDGTIRDVPEDFFDPNANIISRDYIYETNLRSQSKLGKYNTYTMAIPVDFGIDFNISDRVTLRAASSLHYTLTDKIDDLSSINPDYKSRSGNNMFTFSYLSLHLDLFSSDKIITEERLFADLDLDMTMAEDEDDDGILDGWDQCPGTPPNVPVDSVGCPLDKDGDGVPDYLDREDSRQGAIVDEYGVEINDSMVIETFDLDAIRRRDVESYLMMHKLQNRSRRTEALLLPEKFKKVDKNSDGYISYDELLKAINDYFDGDSSYTPDDIKELQDLFFEQ